MSEQKKMNEWNETIVQEVQKERVVMGFCALKGYQILAGGFSLKAIAICAILMIVMVYLSNWISYALAVAEVYETDIATSFGAIPMLLLYIFTALGAVPTLKEHFRK